MTKESQNELAAATRALKKHPFYSVPANALLPLARDICARGGRTEAIGRHIAIGVRLGLKGEAHEKYPVCPNCGQRHPTLAMMMRAFTMAMMRAIQKRGGRLA